MVWLQFQVITNWAGNPSRIFSPGLGYGINEEESNFKANPCLCWEPIKPINKAFYYCDKKFHLDEPIDIYKTEYLNQTKNISITKNYGIVFISGDDYSLYQVTKSSDYYHITKLYGQNVTLAKKHNKGGQSALRFSRLQEESDANYIKIVGEKLVEVFSKNNSNQINKLFICGNGPKKDLLAKSDLVSSRFEIVSSITISSTNQETITNFINGELKEQINKLELDESRENVDKINELIRTNPDILVFGEKEVIKSIDKIEQIYYSDSLDIPIKISNTRVKLIPVNSSQMDTIGINCIGVKFY